MITMKKIIKSFKLIDTNPYKENIDNILKAVLPKSMLRKRKAENTITEDK
jgi:hypothetical protein